MVGGGGGTVSIIWEFRFRVLVEELELLGKVGRDVYLRGGGIVTKGNNSFGGGVW